MKKISLAIILLILISAFSLSAASVKLAPYTGAYGVNMASDRYQGDKHNGKSYAWAPKSIKKGGISEVANFVRPEITADESKSDYTDDHMVAIGGLYGISDRDSNDTYYTITASCPNGFYFRSQTNPNFIRRFELIIVARYSDSVHDYTNDVVNLAESGQAETFHYKGSGSDIWFDLALALPFDGTNPPVAGTNYIVDQGIRYPLVQADDYTALVTLTIQGYENGKLVGTESITIPFSGYYDGQIDGKEYERVSLMFTPSGNAANLNIEQHAGTPMPVGSIDFLLEATNEVYMPSLNIPAGLADNDYVRIFLSSSSEAADSGASEFRFVADSTGPNTPLTNYNSIGYTVTVMGDEGEGGTGSRTFRGNDHITQSGGITNDNAIIPLRHDVNVSRDRDFYTYTGDIYVTIDEPETIMVPGSYSSRVYIHVVTDAGGA